MPGPVAERRIAALTAALLVATALVACDDDGGRIVGVAGGDAPAEAEILEIISGDAQNGRTAEVLPRPLTVRATTSRAFPVSDVRITWAISGGVGSLSEVETVTEPDGETEVLLTPGPVLGETRVTATVEGQGGPSVEFTARTTVFLVSILVDRFRGPLGEDSLQVVVGDTVEWINRDVVRHAVASTVVPDGGFPFQSGDLRNSERFRFVPKAVGTWEYTDPLAPGADPPIGKLSAVGRTVGDLRVITETEGASADAAYVVSVDGLRSSVIGAHDSVTFFNLAAVDHSVRLLEVALNCSVSGENPRVVAVQQEQTVETTFSVSCQ